MHNHLHCRHTVLVCNHCDVAYCTKCSKEWGGYKASWWPTWSTWPNVATGGTASDPYYGKVSFSTGGHTHTGDFNNA